MKLILFTDTHANLPALQAFCQFADDVGHDMLVHLGDAVAIGPHPAECLAILLAREKLINLTGNHDDWLVNGLPEPQPGWLSAGELAHQHWTHTQIGSDMITQVATWPWRLDLTVSDVRVVLNHYPLASNPRSFKPIVKEQTAEALDLLFSGEQSPLIFFGHHHPFIDVTGRSRYINPGSLGCHTEAIARCTILECDKGKVQISHHAIPYDDSNLWADFEARQVPDRHKINQYFFDGRLH